MINTQPKDFRALAVSIIDLELFTIQLRLQEDVESRFQILDKIDTTIRKIEMLMKDVFI